MPQSVSICSTPVLQARRSAQTIPDHADSIGVIVDLDLAPPEVVLSDPGSYHLESGHIRGSAVAAAQVLAVDGDNLAFTQLGDASDPVEKALRERLWGDAREYEEAYVSPMVSCEGMSLGSFKRRLSQLSLALPKCSMATKVSVLQDAMALSLHAAT